MKTIFTLVVAMMMASSIYAQTPNKMSYQAVIRNSSNALIVNKTVGIRISILQTSSSGTEVFAETHTPQTNANGLATLEIGGGSVVSGSFAGIDWSQGPYFIKTETDPTGGTNYTISGVSQILSVPYALQSATANALSTSATGVVRALNGKGGNLFLKGAGGTTINNSGDTISISSSGGSGGTGIQGVQSTDGIVRISNPNGPIATLNINDGSIPAEKLAAGVIPTSASGTAGGDLSGTYPNPLVVKLQGRPMTNTLPTSGQSLAWNGTAWAPSTVSSGWSLTGNTAINPATNFIGTTDSKPLKFRTNNTEVMSVDSNGNLTVGKGTPGTILKVIGSENTNGNIGVGLKLETSVSAPNIMAISMGQPDNDFFKIYNTIYSGGANETRFQQLNGTLRDRIVFDQYENTFFSTKNIERLRIDSAGRVGIGTTSPGKTLDVNGITRISDHLIFNNINGVINWGTADLHFRTNSTVGNEQTYSDKMIIKNNGNVGIGTTAPATKLHVSTSTTGFVSTFEGATGADQATINLKYGGKNGYISHGGWNLGVDYLGFGGQNHAYPDLLINTNSGNVGIGTNAPAAKLDVNGAVRVQTTTQNPVKNTVYGNSTPIAFGTYANTVLITKYGVTSVTKTSAGEFSITLQNATNGDAVVMVTPWDWNAPRVSAWYQFDATHISIKFFTMAGVATDPNGFSFVIFGN